MTLERVIDQLRDELGLDPESLGPSVVSTVIAARSQIAGCADPAAYAAHLRNSPEELEALVNELVVPETWFFRGGELFEHLAQHIRDAARGRSAGRPLRILSAPCSTGEEPYSLAIALAELHVPGRAWHLDAVDISARHLDQARRGRYGELSFRQIDDDVRQRYFRALDNEWEIAESLRSSVEFRRGNLVSTDFLRGQPPYDLIFCRNLLIYLHDAARQRVLANLDRLLAPDGLICMGHAEPLSSLDRRFGSVGPDGYFLFSRSRLVEAADAPARKPPERKAAALPRSTPRAEPKSPRRPGTKTQKRLAAGPSETPSPDLLETARKHADAGRLDQAWADCQTQLAARGPTAEVYAMLGIIHKARRDDIESKRCFEKALYLEPNHSEAILHLMLLYEQEGAHPQAALLRTRLKRAGRGGEG
jgi:chemotaxis protein methyltransferase WspC